ncbi:hypothetical protein M9R32_13995 [Paenisporosarcina quisquiliarum]|uniref:DUF1832 domain-containing protein n=1 Tax=Paenisporosarcina quisquiliarum TaxID=365346 RepID=A0A9X3REW4_9BACL|nr:hypothetical protein [Paenisporosarcina quisquiliarum]MCZ8538304.1 hypothetical protein [Paenisporosarcina quisquiliarum]
MSNRRMNLSEEGKKILDLIVEILEVERPMAVKVALAKGISVSNGPVLETFSNSKNKWTIPDNIIKDKEYLLFKHLILNEVQKPLDEEHLHQHMLLFIEKGLHTLKHEYEGKTSLEDFRLSIL